MVSYYSHYVSSSLERNFQVDTIFTDFKKAFDTVSRGILVSKLAAMGFCNAMLSWLESYFRGRSQVVRVAGVCSSPISVLSGVPQGSHLGPLLFNLLINDRSCIFEHSQFLLYADDLKMFKRISSNEDCHGLQMDLVNFERWCVNK